MSYVSQILYWRPLHFSHKFIIDMDLLVSETNIYKTEQLVNNSGHTMNNKLNIYLSPDFR